VLKVKPGALSRVVRVVQLVRCSKSLPPCPETLRDAPREHENGLMDRNSHVFVAWSSNPPRVAACWHQTFILPALGLVDVLVLDQSDAWLLALVGSKRQRRRLGSRFSNYDREPATAERSSGKTLTAGSRLNGCALLFISIHGVVIIPNQVANGN
jgi:hypothetical protein